jgi:uncharacterized membrane protein
MLSESQKAKKLKSVLEENYRFNIKDYLRRGWEIFQNNSLWLIAYFTIVVSITAAIWFFAIVRPSKLGITVSLTLTFILWPPLGSGFFSGIFAILKKEPLKLSDFFQGFSNFAQLAIANLLSGLLIFIGCFISLILIPGIYLIVGYIFIVPLMLDRKLKFWPAMETSRLIIAKQWFPVAAFLLLLALINLGGAFLFGLGLFVTIPLSYCAIAAAYEDIIGLQQNRF